MPFNNRSLSNKPTTPPAAAAAVPQRRQQRHHRCVTPPLQQLHQRARCSRQQRPADRLSSRSVPLDTITTLAHMDAHTHDTGEAAAAAAAGWPSLLLTCALMFGGAYGCGMLPGWLPNQQRLTASVSAVGAGLLLGSALCIILPEGFEAAMEAEPSLPGWSISGTLLAGFWIMLLLDSISHWLPGGSSSSSSHSHSLGLSSSNKDYRSLSDEELELAAGDPGFSSSPRQGFSSSEHTVLLTDYVPSAGGGGGGGAARPGSAAAAAAAAADVAEGASAAGGALQQQQQQQQQQYTASRRPAVSPRKADRPGTAGGKGGGLPPAPAAAAAAAAGVHQGGSSSSPSGGGPPASSALAGGGSLRRVVSGAGSSGGFGPQAAAAAAAGQDSSSSGPAGGFDGLSRGVGAAGAAAAAKARAGDGAAAAAAGGEWWRPWLVDPTHHALLGLLVHSVSDGLAVGAASLSTVPEVSLSVATAMVVHKGPVAVGLATFLRGQWAPAAVRRGVLLFAAASPLAALLTYGLLSAVPGVTRNVPLVVLFSGGTVLYAAAMHILPEALRGGEHGGKQQERGARRAQLLLVSLGMLLPLLLSALFGGEGHHHHH